MGLGLLVPNRDRQMIEPSEVAIISTAHWAGDPRLNRHRTYLEAAGHRVTLSTFGDSNRMSALVRALWDVLRTDARVVLLTDPELFLPGSLLARITRKRPVIDIHEDYGRAAMARPWVPDGLRGVVRLIAGAAVGAGRIAAWRVLVAAPQLSRDGDYIALNIPDPDTLEPAPHDGSHRLVYVGDVTPARGALAMVEVLGDLDDTFELALVGRVSQETEDAVRASAARAGVADRVSLTGQLDHGEAWHTAKGALIGLNLLEPVPAYADAVATKLWEYMAVGLPPVVSDLPGQARVVARLDEELVCRTPREVAALATRLSQDPGRRTYLAEKGRRLVEKAWADNRPDLVVQSVVEP